jgi:uncharacterized protein YjbI with pentapeptide repeats
MNLESADLSGSALNNADFSQAILKNAQFTGADLTQTNLSRANLEGAIFTAARFSGSNLAGAHVRGAKFLDTTSNGFTSEQLYSTASYQARDLTEIHLGNIDARGWSFADQALAGATFENTWLHDANFSRANLERANFRYALLHGANLTDSIVRHANFALVQGLTIAQLYSTASYQSRDLTGIDLSGMNLSSARFSKQNLAGAAFHGATLNDADFNEAMLKNAAFNSAVLTDADFTGADLRSAVLTNAGGSNTNFSHTNLTNARFEEIGLSNLKLDAADMRGAVGFLPGGVNAIRQDGRIEGLSLTGLQSLMIRNYAGDPSRSLGPIPIRVEQHFSMDATGRLSLLFDDEPWSSIIGFSSNVPVTLGGTLELQFADGVDAAVHVGRSIRIFDWTQVSPAGAFQINSPMIWDLSQLYAAGQITLTAIPEPSCVALLGIAALAMGARKAARRLR